MCSSNLKYNSNTAYGIVNTPNSFLNGSGSITTIISAGSNGTIVNNVIINATGSTSLGMIRLFINDGSSNFLYEEIHVNANDQTEVVQSFNYTYNAPILLKNGFSLGVSTEMGDTFSVIANGNDIESCACS